MPRFDSRSLNSSINDEELILPSTSLARSPTARNNRELSPIRNRVRTRNIENKEPSPVRSRRTRRTNREPLPQESILINSPSPNEEVLPNRRRNRSIQPPLSSEETKSHSPVREISRRRNVSPVPLINTPRTVSPLRNIIQEEKLPSTQINNRTRKNINQEESPQPTNTNRRSRNLNIKQNEEKILRSKLSDIPNDVYTLIVPYLTNEDRANLDLLNKKVKILLATIPYDLYREDAYRIEDLRQFLLKRKPTNIVALNIKINSDDFEEDVKLLESFLPKLVRLRICFNYIQSETIKRSPSLSFLSKCTSLMDFTLYHYYFVSNPALNSIPLLPSVISLHLEKTIYFGVCKKFMDSCPNIRQLKITENDASNIPEPEEPLRFLKRLEIEKFIYLSELNITTYSKFPALEELIINNCTHLKNIEDTDHTKKEEIKIPNIKVLEVKDCTRLESINLTSLTSLTKVVLSYLKRYGGDLNFLEYNKDLTYLFLDLSGQTQLDLNILKNLSNLDYLNLDNIFVQNFTSLEEFPSLKTLITTYETKGDFFIEDLPLPNEVRKYPGITKLDFYLSWNDDLSNLLKCPNLTDLTIHTTAENKKRFSNIFPTFSLDPIKECRELKRLNLDLADVNSLDFLSECPDLETLDITYLSLFKLPELLENNKLKILILDFDSRFESKVPGPIILDPLSNYKNLEVLKLVGTNFNNSKILNNFPNLRILDLRNCRNLENFVLDKPLPNLKELYLGTFLKGDIFMKDISGVSLCPKLKVLYLQSIRNLNNIKPLSDLTYLEELNLSGCISVNDISPLSNLVYIRKLFLANCDLLEDISVLSYLVNLVELNISYSNKLKDLSPLLNCTRLRLLNTFGCYSLRNLVNFNKALEKRGMSINFTDSFGHIFTLPSDNLAWLNRLEERIKGKEIP